MIRKWNILHRELVKDFRLFKVQKKQVRSPRTGEVSEVKVIRVPLKTIRSRIEKEEVSNGMVLLAFFSMD